VEGCGLPFIILGVSLLPAYNHATEMCHIYVTDHLESDVWLSFGFLLNLKDENLETYYSTDCMSQMQEILMHPAVVKIHHSGLYELSNVNSSESIYDAVFFCHCVWQEIQWQQIPGNMSQYDIVLPPGEDSGHYKFGIASQSTDGWRSGISWASCLFRANSSQ